MGMNEQPTPDAARDAAWIAYRNSLFYGTYPYPPEVLPALKESTDLWTQPTFAAGWDACARFEAQQREELETLIQTANRIIDNQGHVLAAERAAREAAEAEWSKANDREIAERAALLECRQRIEEWRRDGVSAADMRAFLLGLQRAYGLAALPTTEGI